MLVLPVLKTLSLDHDYDLDLTILRDVALQQAAVNFSDHFKKDDQLLQIVPLACVVPVSTTPGQARQVV